MLKGNAVLGALVQSVNKMDLISALKFLKLEDISQAWVDEVWDLEFTEKKALEDVAMEEEGEWEEQPAAAARDEAFKALYQCLLVHAADQRQSTGGDRASASVWSMLGESRVSIKSLVAVLSSFVLPGKDKAAGVQQRVSALHAASIYVLLLGIPGSIANKVFHEVLLDTCANLASHCWPQDSGRKRKKDGLKSSQADSKRAKPKRKEAAQMDTDEDEEEEEEEEIHFSNQDLLRIRDGVVLLVQSLLRLLQTFPLKDQQQSASNCTLLFSKMLYFEPVVGELTFTAEQDITKLRSIPEMAFYGLQLLISPKHGDQKESLQRIFYRLLFVILMKNKANRGEPSLLAVNQNVLAARQQAIHFVCHLVSELKEVALPLLHILLQHICSQMVERNEYRNHGAQAVGMLTAQMENKDYASFIKWLAKLSRSAKVVHRLFSVDVVMVLLEQPERQPQEGDLQGGEEEQEEEEEELATVLSHKFLIQSVLFGRRMDSSPTVQGHALACLAQCLELPSLNATQAVHHLFSATGTPSVLEVELTEGGHQTQKTYRTLPFRTVELCTTDSFGSDAKENLALLLRRVEDSRTTIRKSALQALVGLLKHGVIPVTSDNLTTLSHRCRDPAISVKKKALQCLGELLAVRPECPVVQKAWLQGIIPAVLDMETTVQDKALESLDQVLLSQVKLYSAGRHLDAAQRLTWSLLGLLCSECQDLSGYFSRAVGVWSKKNSLTSRFIANLISHTDAEHATGAWLLLSKVASLSAELPCSKILDAFDGVISGQEVNVATCCHILSVVGDSAAHLNEDTRTRIVAELLSWLKTFSLSLTMISAAIDTLCQLGSSDDIKQTQAFLSEHCGELVAASEAYLAGIILTVNGTDGLNEELMVRHLHTLGAASLHCPAKVSKRTVLLVESVLTTHSDGLAGSEEELPASLPLSQFRTNSFTTRIRAHGVISLGKLCLQREELVHKYLPVFARELELGTEVAVRSNVAVVMCDLCVRYTNLVDHYIPNLSACLRDDEAVVREQTLIMLTGLLQEEYIKWKGSLFFRFMVALVDPVPAIASLCEYCLLHLLLKNNPEMFSQHFIEGIFHFNSYSKHKSYNKFSQSDREKVRFSLKGAQHREKRFRIYRFLLENFTDVQRFNVSNKINQTVLACFADEELPLDQEGAEILSETFSILSLKEMKLHTGSSAAAAAAAAGGAAGEDGDEEGSIATMTKKVLQAAQKKVVQQVHKKVFIEHTVPLIISLKNLLERKRSPVLGELMTYLQVVMQDYRNEVKVFFSSDEQLAAEVEFILKSAEKQRELEEQMVNCSLAGQSKTTPAAKQQQPEVQGSPLRSKTRLSLNFTTPQPPPSRRPLARLAHTDSRVLRPMQVGNLQPGSSTLEGTVMPKGQAFNRAISTPKSVNISLTFNEGVSAIFCDRGPSVGGEGDVLHIRSNEQLQQAAGPKQWNVQSPLRPNRRSAAAKST
ncbi:condensin-2 complex subunit D3 isoform X3 [Nelusetta ayraudi]|uniref:condensin-2 complex subunit D3 isoform X3 n=1 Tax=Nelusetta ayraudi TaxID=303726 RepID=UPI003F72648A